METIRLLCFVLLVGCVAGNATARQREHVPGEKEKIEVVVHRGANHLAPENTVASALAALEEGAGWIELDVRASKDGVLYNLHDETLDRTTNGSGLISEWMANDIDTLDAGSWFAPQFKGERVPTIAGMLDVLKGKAKVFFDVKRGVCVESLVALIRSKGYEQDCFCWFSDPDMLKTFLREAPEVKVKVNASDIARLQEWQAVCTPSFVEIAPEKVTPEFRRYCREHGIRIMAAIQDGTEENYRRAIAVEPDLVNLDRPELWRRICPEENR